MKKRVIALLLASFMLVSTTVYGYTEAQAAETTAITWTDELLYAFELFCSSSGVRVSSKAVPGVALAWEAQARVETPETQAYLAELSQSENGAERLNIAFGETFAGFEDSLASRWITSIRDFFASDDVSVGYGSDSFGFNDSFLNSLQLDENASLSDTMSEFMGVPVYNCLPPVSLIKYRTGYNTLVSQYDTYFTYVIDGRIGNVHFGIDSIAVRSGTFSFSYEAKCYPYYNNNIDNAGSGSVKRGTETAIYVSPGITFTFPENPELADYVTEGALSNLVSGIKSFFDIQSDALVKIPAISDIFTIPTTAEGREAVLSGVRGADTSEVLVKALADAGITVFPKTDVDTDPDIDVDIDAESTNAIVKALAALQTSVRAIPTQITDFFTIDTTAVDKAYEGLITIFKSRFSGLEKLGTIFQQDNRSFDDTPPVFTMKVPQALKFVYPGQDTMVIMDLREFAGLFSPIRLILQAILWYMFARWLLNEFDVKFHVG